MPEQPQEELIPQDLLDELEAARTSDMGMRMALEAQRSGYLANPQMAVDLETDPVKAKITEYLRQRAVPEKEEKPDRIKFIKEYMTKTGQPVFQSQKRGLGTYTPEGEFIPTTDVMRYEKPKKRGKGGDGLGGYRTSSMSGVKSDTRTEPKKPEEIFRSNYPNNTKGQRAYDADILKAAKYWKDREKVEEQKDKEERRQEIPGFSRDPNIEVTPQKVAELREGVGLRDTVLSQIDELESFIQEHGNTELTGAAAGKVDSHVQNMIVNLNKVSKLGALSGPDMEILGSQIPNPAEFSSTLRSRDYDLGRLRALRANVIKFSDDAIRSYGYSKGSAKKQVKSLPARAVSSQTQYDKALQWLNSPAAKENPELAEKVRMKYNAAKAARAGVSGGR